MNAPRLEINLDKIEHNARTLNERLTHLGISVMGITKSVLGSADIAGALIRAGITRLGDSRIENIQNLRRAQLGASLALIRSPMVSQVNSVVANTDVSFNTELDVINRLSHAALKTGRLHGIVLMVELGDLREGILPENLESIVRKSLKMPGITVKGIGTNLACSNGVSPDHKNMSELSALANSLESALGIQLNIVSGGNSANLNWVFGSSGPGRINHLRLGESLLLGCETLNRQPINGLYTDAITLIAEVIESKTKPSLPWGTMAETAFGKQQAVAADRGDIVHTLLAIGRQDIDPQGLIAPLGVTIRDASSDHLIVQSDEPLPVGTELSFRINYSALVRAMTSPFVKKKITSLLPTCPIF